MTLFLNNHICYPYLKDSGKWTPIFAPLKNAGEFNTSIWGIMIGVIWILVWHMQIRRPANPSLFNLNSQCYRNYEQWQKLQTVFFIFGTACQIYCYGRYCVRRSVSPQVPENPSGPLVDNFIVLPCVAFGVACVKLLPGVERWNSLDDPRVIGPCHCEVWGWPRH